METTYYSSIILCSHIISLNITIYDGIIGSGIGSLLITNTANYSYDPKLEAKVVTYVAIVDLLENSAHHTVH